MNFDIQIDMIEKINKIIASVILTISVAIAGIKEISVLLSDDVKDKILLTIKVFSRFSRCFADTLSKQNEIDLDAKNINTYLTLLLLEHCSAQINVICKDDFLELKIAI